MKQCSCKSYCRLIIVTMGTIVKSRVRPEKKKACPFKYRTGSHFYFQTVYGKQRIYLHRMDHHTVEGIDICKGSLCTSSWYLHSCIDFLSRKIENPSNVRRNLFHPFWPDRDAWYEMAATLSSWILRFFRLRSKEDERKIMGIKMPWNFINRLPVWKLAQTSGTIYKRKKKKKLALLALSYTSTSFVFLNIPRAYITQQCTRRVFYYFNNELNIVGSGDLWEETRGLTKPPCCGNVRGGIRTRRILDNRRTTSSLQQFLTRTFLSLRIIVNVRPLDRNYTTWWSLNPFPLSFLITYHHYWPLSRHCSLTWLTYLHECERVVHGHQDIVVQGMIDFRRPVRLTLRLANAFPFRL